MIFQVIGVSSGFVELPEETEEDVKRNKKLKKIDKKMKVSELCILYL